MNNVKRSLRHRFYPLFKRIRSRKGWTFIETLVVIIIILVLSSAVGFTAFRYVGQARQVSARSQIESYSLALTSYYLDSGVFPSKEQGLWALYERPVSPPVPAHWNGPYVDKRPGKDPWGNDWVYNIPAANGLPFEIISLGADGFPGGEDQDADIVSWETE